MLEQILYPALSIGVIGLFFGAVLAFASIIFKVEKDERIDKIAEILPGANCGGCGFAGCSAFAQAIVEDGAPITSCNLMTAEKAQQIADIMGVEATENLQSYTATVHVINAQTNARFMALMIALLRHHLARVPKHANMVVWDLAAA